MPPPPYSRASSASTAAFVTPGIRSSSGTHSTLLANELSLAHAASFEDTKTMRLGPTYWLSAATASLVTHVGLAATLTTSRARMRRLGRARRRARAQRVGGQARARASPREHVRKDADMERGRGERGDAEEEEEAHAALADGVGSSARPRRLSSAGSDRPVDLAAIGGSPPRYYGKRRSVEWAQKNAETATVADEAFLWQPTIYMSGRR